MGCIRSKPSGAQPIISINDLSIFPGLFVQSHGKGFASIYKLGKLLGSGSFGEVRACVHKLTNIARAVKIVNKEELSSSELKGKFLNELEILKRLDHPHIIRVFECFNEQENYYVVQEYCGGGELFKEIMRIRQFSEERCAKIMKQIFSAIAYLHEQNIAHRDIKPENIIFTDKSDNLSIRIIDFGTTAVYNEKKPLRELIGSPYYVAPEVLKGSYSYKCDLWSAGVIMYIMLSGYAPFEGKTDDEILKKIKKLDYSFAEDPWGSVSSKAKQLIQKLLVPERSRISAVAALFDNWINKYTAVASPSEETMKKVLSKLSEFKSSNKFTDAIRTYIASQLTTPQELKEPKEVFLSLDADGDGKLSKTELLRGCTGRIQTAEATVDHIMEQVDTDNNGYIDFTEFLRATMDSRKFTEEESMQSAFSIFDKDHNGRISSVEVCEVLTGRVPDDTNIWTQLIQEIDLNGDGEIDLDEFKSMMLKNL